MRPPVLRPATPADLDAIVALAMEDAAARATASHRAALDAITADARNEMLVVDGEDGRIAACLQITYIPGLGGGGGDRALIEEVRVREDLRGAGLGTRLVQAAIDRARDRGCRLVQLTSSKRRTEAHRFYGALGFEATHEGFKLLLESEV